MSRNSANPTSPTSAYPSGGSMGSNGSGGGGGGFASSFGSSSRRAAAAVLANARGYRDREIHHVTHQQAQAASRPLPSPNVYAGVASPPTEPMLPEEMRARAREQERERLNAARSASTAMTYSISSGAASSTSTLDAQEMARNPSATGSVRGSHPEGTPPTPSEPAGPRYSSSHMESSVTRLLVATKMLLEALTKWSLGQRTETQVSDIYVRLGNDFNTANVAFGSYGIDMSDLASVPDDLRACLEQCLSEDASPQILEVHLPRIREIIIRLLQGLKTKQAEYKQFLLAQRGGKRRSNRVGLSESNPSTTATAPTEALDPENGDARSAPQRASSAGAGGHNRTSSSGGGSLSRRPGVRPPSRQLRASVDESSNEGGAVEEPRRRGSARSVATAPQEEQIAEDVPVPPLAEQQRASLVPDNVKRHSLVDRPMSEVPAAEQDEAEVLEADSDSKAAPLATPISSKSTGSKYSQASRRTPSVATTPTSAAMDAPETEPSLRALKSRDALERRASKRFSAYTFNKMGVGGAQNFGALGLGMGITGLGATSPGASPGLSGSRVLVDPRTQSVRRGAAGVRSPADLLSSDASTGGASHARRPSKSSRNRELEDVNSASEGHGGASPRNFAGGLSPDPTLPQRRTSRGSPAHSPRASQAKLKAPSPTGAGSSMESLPMVDAPASPGEAAGDDDGSAVSVPPVPPLPTAEERKRLDAVQNRALALIGSTSTTGNVASSLPPSLSTTTMSSSLASGVITPTPNNPKATQIGVFLQLGRQTRRAVLEVDPTAPTARGLTIAKLRMLFMDRFAYSPGKDDFPTIYVKDPASGVSYELEDLNEVSDGTLLSLNIEPLDQVKQHLDLSLGTITRELRELKAAVYERERDISRRSVNYTADAQASQPLPISRITDSQFTAAGARVAQLKKTNALRMGGAGDLGDGDAISPSLSGISSSTAGGSAGFSGARIANELKSQYDDVQTLRRELAVMRQMHADFSGDVGGLLASLKAQSSKVRAIASAEVPTERNFILAGKAKLDGSSQEVLTLVEDLQDTVDDLKLDVIQRGVKPKPALMKKIGEDIAKATSGLEELEKYVETVKPSWKKTWEAELQNIVDEQEFLNHQEGLIADLRDDHVALQEVFDNIQQVVKLRGSGKPPGSGRGGYLPPPPEEGHAGLSTVMLEVRGQAIDHEKRLRALQAAEKQRQKELQTRTDDFTDELAGFVVGKVGVGLRKTGGHLEAERVRSRRDKLTLQAMFSGGADSVGGAAGVVGGSTAPPPSRLILGRDGASALDAGGGTGGSKEGGAEDDA